LKNFLHGIAPWTHAITLSLRRRDIANKPITEAIIKDTAAHLIRRINFSCLGSSKARRGKTIASAVVYGLGSYGDNPHLHISLACPKFISKFKFEAILENAFAKTYWLARERKVTPYVNEGWSGYLAKHGFEYLIDSLLHSSNYE
jgi:hypothetical protein